MAWKEPKVWPQIQHGPHQTLAILTARLCYFRDAVEHQHRRKRQLGISCAEQFAARAGETQIEDILVQVIDYFRRK